MSEHWQRRLRRLRMAVGAILASVLIAVAVAMALGQLLLPLLHAHPQQVARVLAWSLDRPVSIGSVRGQWQASGPLLSATDLRIGSGTHALVLPAAQLKVDFGAWLKSDTRWLELRVKGLEVDLSRDASGGWHLAGLGSQGEHAGADALTGLPVGLLLRDLTVKLDDVRSRRQFQWHASVLRAISKHGSLRVAARITTAGRAPPLTVVAHVQSAQRTARLYVSGRDVDLAAWSAGLDLAGITVQSARANHLQLWLDWRNGSLNDASAKLALSDIALSAPQARKVRVAQWDGRVQAHRDGGGWRATWVDTLPAGAQPAPASATLNWTPARAGGSGKLRIDAQALDVAAVAPWLALLPQVPDTVKDWLSTAAVHGRVDDVHLRWTSASHFWVQAQLANVGFAVAGAMPGIASINGALRGDAEAFTLQLPAQPLTVDAPQMFGQPFTLQQVDGTLALWRHRDGWMFASDGLQLAGAGFGLTARGSVATRHGSSPLLDLAAVVSHADITAVKHFWPIHAMPKATVAWLNHGLVSGTVTGGRLVVRGHLADWPFAHDRGRFEATATVHNVVLDYDPHWPRAEGIDAHATFVNTGMEVRCSAARTLGNRVDKAHASIADFARPELTLQVSGHGAAVHLLDFVRKSPIGKQFGAALRGLHVTGKADVDVNLTLPLHDEPGAGMVLNGQARLRDAGFSAPAWSLQLTQLNGDFEFDKAGFASTALHGRFHAQPVALEVKVGDAVRDQAQQLEASMRGHFDAASLLAGYGGLQSLAAISRGAADFKVALTVSAAADLASGTAHLSVDSNLRGMALMLPAPLDKPAPASMPLHVGVDLPFAGQTLALSLDDVLSAQLRLPDTTHALAANIALGGPASAPGTSGMVVHGHAARLDVSGWVRRALASSGSVGSIVSGLPEVDLVAAQVGVFGRHFQNLALQLQPGAAQTVLTLSGPQVAGTITIPNTNLGQRGITARLDRLYWPDDSDDGKPTGKAAQAVADATGMAPAAVPPLHVRIGDLRLGQARLGKTRFESYPTVLGMHIEQLETHAPDVQISARGNWTGDKTASQSHLAIDFSSPDLGRMLDAFGYSGMVAGGSTLAHIDATWPGPPVAFSLAALDGTMSVHVEHGRILNVSPGVGRLFGLFSIRELPRRLSLGFGDLFKSGFSFNSIDGHFVFADGNAHTSDLTIRGPAAAIHIRGRTGLRQHDYDQFIDVTPHVGTALPVVGAIAGGPIGAAAGLAVQTLLGRGLGQAAGVHYHVTGSWDHPTITALARDDQHRAPLSPLAPPSSASATTPPGAAAAGPASVPAPAATPGS